MDIHFSKDNKPKPVRVFLCTSSRELLCELNSIDEESFSVQPKINDTCKLSFSLNPYVYKNGKKIKANGYEIIDKLMTICVDTIGWFLLTSPEQSQDGISAKKHIKCESLDISMKQHDLVGFHVNTGLSDSLEMLAQGNTETIDGVTFAKNYITFCNKKHPELSLLHLALKFSGMNGWDIGYVDSKPKMYERFVDGEIVRDYIALSDEKGTFDIQNKNLYSFFTQDVSKYFKCIFVFDFKNMLINAYRPENLGKDTNIILSFRNVQNNNSVTVNDSDIFTRYYVSGGDNLGIESVNFGHNYIENLDYFKNGKYMSQDLIEKYNLWEKDVEEARLKYIRATQIYNQILTDISEIENKLPLEDCSKDWSRLSDEQLDEKYNNYIAQKKGYEVLYVDTSGDFDLEELKQSTDWEDYRQIVDIILPSISIELSNRNIHSMDAADYIDSYKTDWQLYGLHELEVKLSEYRNTIKLCRINGYDVPYTSETNHTRDYHLKMFEKYTDALYQLNENMDGSCKYYYDKLDNKIKKKKETLEIIQDQRNGILRYVDKNTWVHINEDGTEISFTENDLLTLSNLYIEGDYSNNNMFLVSSDDNVTAIDEQLKLLNAAKEDLVVASQPQYIYQTDNTDSFISDIKYENYTKYFNIGNFIYIETDDNHIVKLRCISYTYNPLLMDDKLSIEFSNMINTKADRNDFVSMLEDVANHGKNSVSIGSNSYAKNDGEGGLSPALVQRIINMATQDARNSLIGDLGHTITIDNLVAELVKAGEVRGENGYFEYLQSKLITSDSIVSDSADFQALKALVAGINTLITGSTSAELGQIIKLTSENVHIDEAVIRELIATKMTVSMLQAGDISTNKFNIVSDDGGITIKDNTMIFKDRNNHLRLQVGKDSTGDFTFVLYDEAGQGVLIDSTGIKPSAISDGLIKTDMIADGSITENKLDKSNIMNWTDSEGNRIFDISNMYFGDDKFEVRFKSIVDQTNLINEKLKNMQENVSSIEIQGEQIFVDRDGDIQPGQIVLTAMCRYGAIVDHWLIDGELATDHVSDDKSTLTIPNNYMREHDSLLIKVVDDTGEIYDTKTLYLLKDSRAGKDGSDGRDSYNVLIFSDDGTVFRSDTVIDKTTCVCKVFKGAELIEPDGYDWQIMDEEDGRWRHIGDTKTIILPIDKSKVRRRLRCLVEMSYMKGYALHVGDSETFLVYDDAVLMM